MSTAREAWAWPGRRPLIGMVHLMPLPGAPGWRGSMDEVLERALSDAAALHEAGFDGVIVENFGDVPFHPGAVPSHTIAAMTRAVTAVKSAVPVPVGVNVLRNDAAGAVGIAAATGATIARVNVHTGAMWTDQGLILGAAHETLRLRSTLGTHVALLADVHVKHAAPPAGSSIEQAAADAWHRGLADALIVSGSGTGSAADVREVHAVKKAMPEATVLLGSGVTADNAARLLAVSDGAIVGTSVMRDARPGSGIDPERARRLIEAAQR